MQALWSSTPASHRGEYFEFSDVYCEPSPLRPTGPTLWFGGQWMHPALRRRLVEHGSGFHPFGAPNDDDLRALATAMTAAGRSITELEMIGGTRARFTGTDDVADLDDAMRDIADQVAAGYTTFCMKPSQHTDDIGEVGGLCRRMVDHLARLEAERPG